MIVRHNNETCIELLIELEHQAQDMLAIARIEVARRREAMQSIASHAAG